MHDMTTLLPLAKAALTGTALGALFFGGLWWTVRRAAVSPRPSLWFGPSLLLRTATVVGGFYLAGGAHWPRLAACLAGFVLARIAVLRLAKPGAAAASGAQHAS